MSDANLFFVPSDACKLEPDPNTANRNLKLSDNDRKVTAVQKPQPYPDHPERFTCYQLLCRKSLTGRCYWEVEWRGCVTVGVTYRGLRRGSDALRQLGRNHQSWSLKCSDGGYSVWHNDREKVIPVPSTSKRVGVYVDCPAGTLSFYRVSSDSLTHLHTFNTTFTEPLYPGFLFWSFDSAVTLCEL